MCDKKGATCFCLDDEALPLLPLRLPFHHSDRPPSSQVVAGFSEPRRTVSTVAIPRLQEYDFEAQHRAGSQQRMPMPCPDDPASLTTASTVNVWKLEQEYPLLLNPLAFQSELWLQGMTHQQPLHPLANMQS